MKISYKILIPLAVFFVLLIAGMSVFVKSAITNILITEEFIRVTENVERDIQKLLTPEDFADPLSPASQERFQNFFKSVSSSLIARMRVWDRNYRIVFSDLKKQIGFINPAHTDVQKLFLDEEPFFISKRKDINEPVEEGSETFSDMYVPVRFAGKTVGAVEIHLVAASVLGEVSKEMNFIIMMIAAGIAILLPILFAAIQLVVLRPLARLTKASQEIRAGNFDYSIPPGSSDEIGHLVSSFMEMERKLKDSFSALEEKNKQIAEKFSEVERLNKLMVGRELRMAELKKEIAALKEKSL